MADVEETNTLSGSSSSTSQDSTQPAALSVVSSPTASATIRHSHLRFPVRVGISWVKGERLEAMDFSRTWYPSKIVEIDEDQKLVLIHFEGWNQRYDEWVPMDSDKLRPVTRHSERKDKSNRKRRIHPHPIYRAGELVLAKWSDCKKYPAKISRLMEDGSYEVHFYDGVSCNIQAMNIQPMPEEMKSMKLLSMKSPPSLKPKLSFKNIKVTLPESIKKKVEESRERNKMMASTKAFSSQKCSLSPKMYIKREIKPNRLHLSPLKIRAFKKSHTSGESEASMSPVIEAGCSKTFSPSPEVIDTSSTTASPSLPDQLSTPETSQEKTTEVLKKSVMVKGPDEDSALTQTITAAEITQATDSEPVHTAAVISQVTEHEPIHLAIPKPVEVLKRPGRKRRKKKSFQCHIIKTDHSKNETPKIPKLKITLPSSAMAQPKLEQPKVDASAIPTSTQPIPLAKIVPAKAFVVEVDHNPFKCPHEGCNKAFRKENLLAYHIKYYHTDTESVPHTPGEAASPLVPSPHIQSPSSAPVVRRRRKKTNSVCSTDSDLSIGSKGKSSSKRQRHDSEISVTTASPDLVSRDLWADVKPQRVSQDSLVDEVAGVETEEEEMESDIVNCVCGLRETNGLMIQCDVCMCWQHFACVDNKNTGEPPANYVCFICENTPGIRDSCKYIHDMGWEKRGDLPTFPFLTEAPSEHLKTIACECNDLSGTLHKIKAALHSTRRQIKISKEDGDSEFQLWQTDWDNWTKPDEDLALTPRSADPDPSPTPSTFLFSSVPTSTPTITTTNCMTFPPFSATDLVASHPATTTSTTVSSSNMHSYSTLTTTIEVSSTLPSPSIISQASEQNSTETVCSSSTPPPGSLRCISSSAPAPTLPQAKAGNLNHHTFPGPSGDSNMAVSAADKPNGRQEGVTANDLTRVDPGNTRQQSWSEITESQTDPKTNISALGSDPQTPRANVTDGTPLVGPAVDRSTLPGCLDKPAVPESVDKTDHTNPLPIGSPLDGDADDNFSNQSKNLSELYIDVNGAQSHSAGYNDDQDNDTDTAEESVDPYKNCEHNLLVHVTKVHHDIEKHLQILEQQIVELEKAEHCNPTVQLSEENILNDVPALKKSLGKLARNVYKVQRLCIHN
ncbi:PHD finger protein 20-like isoform X2 [Physella acuta]|uniref:PHD finger protein 20-like isoform X2 n=1 Tax=Physella acuta TaxID=109671 RepID=UPI0027DB2344|nr:PHD finger protein 20-like isoform X2 [Physella acuta]